MKKHISGYVFPFEKSKALYMVGKNSGTQQHITDKTIQWKSVHDFYELFFVRGVKRTYAKKKDYSSFFFYFFAFLLVLFVKRVVNTFSKDIVTLIPWWSTAKPAMHFLF